MSLSVRVCECQVDGAESGLLRIDIAYRIRTDDKRWRRSDRGPRAVPRYYVTIHYSIGLWVWDY